MRRPAFFVLVSLATLLALVFSTASADESSIGEDENQAAVDVSELFADFVEPPPPTEYEVLEDGTLLDLNPYATDAVSVSELRGISQEAAEYLLRSQEEYTPLLKELERLAGDQLAGAYFAPEGEFAIVIRITGNEQGAPPELVAAIAASDAPIELIYSAGHTQAQLSRAQTQIDWRNLLPEWNGDYTDVVAGTFNIMLLSDEAATTTTVAEFLARRGLTHQVDPEILEQVGTVLVVLKPSGEYRLKSSGEYSAGNW